MTTTETDTGARVYVGTYHKYACGSIKGAWLNLEDYANKDDFLKACADLHKDESDPELMFQDFEGFPRSFYSESSINAAVWDWLELDEDERELLAVYQHNVNQDGDIDEAREAFSGRFNSEEDWAADFLRIPDRETGSACESRTYSKTISIMSPMPATHDSAAM